MSLTCGVCRQPLTDTYLINAWNIPYHRHHPTCWSCARPTTGTRRTTTLCPTCRATRVTTQAQSVRRARAIRDLLTDRGITIPSGTIKFVLTKAALMASQTCLGLTTTRTTARTKKITISIRHGLPAIHHDLVVAHELTHAYLQLNDAHPTALINEGLAERNAYWHLGRVGGPTAAIHQHHIATNPDPTYGNGYRTITKAEHAHGWPTLLHHVLTTGTIPGQGVGRLRGHGRG